MYISTPRASYCTLFSQFPLGSHLGCSYSSLTTVLSITLHTHDFVWIQEVPRNGIARSSPRGAFRAILRLCNSQETSQDSACGCIHYCDLLWQSMYQAQSLKGKGPGADVWETRHRLPKVLFQWIHTGHAEFPKQRLVTICELWLTREAHWRRSANELFSEDWDHEVQLPCLECTQLHSPRRKAGVQHKSHGFY